MDVSASRSHGRIQPNVIKFRGNKKDIVILCVLMDKRFLFSTIKRPLLRLA